MKRKLIIYPGVPLERIPGLSRAYDELENASKTGYASVAIFGSELFDPPIATVYVYQTKTARVFRPAAAPARGG